MVDSIYSISHNLTHKGFNIKVPLKLLMLNLYVVSNNTTPFITLLATSKIRENKHHQKQTNINLLDHIWLERKNKTSKSQFIFSFLYT